MTEEEMNINKEADVNTNDMAVVGASEDETSLTEVVIGAVATLGSAGLAYLGIKKGVPIVKNGWHKLCDWCDEIADERKFMSETRKAYRQQVKENKELAKLAEKSEVDSVPEE